ncbi:aminotransferase class I/II-fold pyridoxal phosphate-dependent enzyme [Erythrobacter arachoides]|uniref:Aminotransferase class I/II-fold pyridoxal phosphate-dependent enzyme n=1 Tax=Aurantiacibacter arachoides TaxID=1850444 RepID=A0A845A3X7_9SPHN|nr:8-amino-7-oxononanoate synthase [Aurantiacibacter arachoides]MXO93836.1 aminotransferase class I/II-fold pyridoxal phosphate-dependent enzyme [Aurantiacibacter arachoides]GGD46334.1 8-amino-7-ketopelargonate synthase [Aurantiacibacter arachoides]
MRHRFAQALDQRRAQHRLRVLRPLEPGAPGHVRLGARELLDLSSNDYLGLARHPELARRAGEWAVRYGTGARASRLVSGTLEPHRAVEEKVAAWKGTEAALLFATGWQANAALFPALLKLEPQAAVFADWLVHASIHHGIAAARTKHTGYRHNDLAHLDALLGAAADAPGRLVATESVFSMDGDRADLASFVALARRHDALSVVDEAHATGVLGAGGAGLAAELEDRPDIVMGTFSKAMGGFGAFVAASRDICDYLANAASGFVYTTAPPPPVLGAMDAALDLVPGMDDERAHVAALATRLRAGMTGLGYATGPSDTQIVPVIIGGEAEALAASAALERAGILAVAIRPPTVPEGESRLRFSLSAAHSEAQIDRVLEAMADLR